MGSVAKQILKEFGIIGFSHVIQIGNVKLDFYPKTYTLIKEKAEKSDVRCADDLTADRMRNAIDEAAETAVVWQGKIETRTTVCPQCGKPAGNGKFCNYCGAPLGTQRCPNCGAQVALGLKFCGECGTPRP